MEWNDIGGLTGVWGMGFSSSDENGNFLNSLVLGMPLIKAFWPLDTIPMSFLCLPLGYSLAHTMSRNRQTSVYLAISAIALAV